MNINDKTLKLLEGAYDAHLHANPGLYQTRDSILDIAKMARAYGMKGLVYKDMQFCTAPQAEIVREAVPGIDVIGGVALFAALGGLNPWAVEASFKAGGRVVWMFTLDSAFQIEQFTRPDYPYPPEHNRNMLVDIESGGYTVFKDGTDRLKDEAREIIALCKQYDGVFETSHLSPEEAFAMVREARLQGVKKIVITHIDSVFTPYTVEQAKAFVELGAMIGFCSDAYMPRLDRNPASMGSLFEKIRIVGPENTLIGSDAGAFHWPSSPESIRIAIAGLLAGGFTEEEVSLIVRTNPDRYYGL